MPVLVPAPRPGRPCNRDESLDKEQPLVWTVESFWTPEQCAAFIARIDDIGARPAPIMRGGKERYEPGVRNNSRVMFDDQPLADALDELARPHIPPVMFAGAMRPAGICMNERFRGYRYEPGEQFAPHFDGSFKRDEREESLLTFMIYLNEGFGGGATRFEDFDVTVTPHTGLAIFFQHRLLHEGCRVESGTKYILRSDILYRAVSP